MLEYCYTVIVYVCVCVSFVIVLLIVLCGVQYLDSYTNHSPLSLD